MLSMKNNLIRFTLAAVFTLFSGHLLAEVSVSNAVVRVLPPGLPNTSAYFTIQNTSDSDVFLVAAETNIAASAELHAHIMNGEMMRMEEQEQVVIPAGEVVEFKPGGLHVMIFGLKAPIKEGQMVSITLVTKDKKMIAVQAKAVRPGDEKQQHHHH